MKISHGMWIGLVCLSLIGCNQVSQDKSTDDDRSNVNNSQVEDSSVKNKDNQDNNQSKESSKITPKINPKTTSKSIDGEQVISNKPKRQKQPKIGRISQIQQGDNLCYVILIDNNGKEHNLGATFEICEQEKTLINQQVRLTYGEVSVNDCESAEPCGKSRRQTVITKAVVINKPTTESTKKDLDDSSTISNGKWTVTIGNGKSWNGVNGTGNLTYKGCDNKGSCLSLKGGKVTVRDGIIRTVWQNGDYTYIVEGTITEDIIGNTSTLIVRNQGKEILRETGLK